MSNNGLAGSPPTANVGGSGTGGGQGVVPVSAGAGGVVRPRAKPKKPVHQDAERIVQYYRFTEHELSYIAAPHKDVARAAALIAFYGSVVLNVIVSFSFGTPDSDVVKGAWIAAGVISAGMTLHYFLSWRQHSRDANSRLQKIKDEHDFGT